MHFHVLTLFPEMIEQGMNTSIMGRAIERGYISLKEKDMSQNMCQKIEDSAKGFGADMLITACPLCKYNLNKNASSELPVYYFTELLAEALGVKEEVAK